MSLWSAKRGPEPSFKGYETDSITILHIKWENVCWVCWEEGDDLSRGESERANGSEDVEPKLVRMGSDFRNQKSWHSVTPGI